MENIQYLVFVTAALGLGVLISIYTPMISSSSSILGSSLAGSVVFFFIAFASSVALLFLTGDSRALINISNIPTIYFISGVLSAVVIFGVSLLVPVLGLRRFIILMIAGQIIMSVIAGHFGFLGVPRDPLTIKKVIGFIFVVLGIYFSVAE